MRMAQIREVVLTLGWLSETDAEFAEGLVSAGQPIVAFKGNHLIEEQEDAAGLIGIVEGSVALQRSPANDGPIVTGIAGPGFWFGEYAFITGSKRLVSAVVTSHQVTAVGIAKPDLERLLADHPEYWRWIALQSAQNMAGTIVVASSLLITDSYKRICAILTRLAQPNGDIAEVNCRHEDLAEMSSLSRSTVIRIIRELEGKGLVTTDYGKIVVQNPAFLRRELI
jgi:CRP/FNR family transcriptional regulator, cyclic AMP receptor protein